MRTRREDKLQGVHGGYLWRLISNPFGTRHLPDPGKHFVNLCMPRFVVFWGKDLHFHSDSLVYSPYLKHISPEIEDSVRVHFLANLGDDRQGNTRITAGALVLTPHLLNQVVY